MIVFSETSQNFRGNFFFGSLSRAFLPSSSEKPQPRAVYLGYPLGSTFYEEALRFLDCYGSA